MLTNPVRAVVGTNYSRFVDRNHCYSLAALFHVATQQAFSGWETVSISSISRRGRAGRGMWSWVRYVCTRSLRHVEACAAGTESAALTERTQFNVVQAHMLCCLVPPSLRRVQLLGAATPRFPLGGDAPWGRDELVRRRLAARFCCPRSCGACPSSSRPRLLLLFSRRQRPCWVVLLFLMFGGLVGRSVGGFVGCLVV